MSDILFDIPLIISNILLICFFDNNILTLL